MTPYGFVYITENLVNGKRYIGQRAYVKAGWETYLGSGKLLRKAISRYGKENFSRTIVFEAFTKEGLDEAETWIIASYDAVNDPMFYNLVPGGHGCSYGFAGKKHSPETREKMRLAALGHPVSEKTRQAVAENGRKNIQKARVAFETKYDGTIPHPRSISVTIDGIGYTSVNAAKKATGYTYQKIMKIKRGEPLDRKRPVGKSTPITIDGITYPSMTDARSILGIGYKEARIRGGLQHRKPGNLRPVIIDGVAYISVSEAARKLNVSHHIIRKLNETDQSSQ